MEKLKNIIGLSDFFILFAFKLLSLLAIFFAPHVIPANQLGEFSLVFSISVILSSIITTGFPNQIKAGYRSKRLLVTFFLSITFLISSFILSFFVKKNVMIYIGLTASISIQIVIESFLILKNEIKSRLILSMFYEMIPIYLAILLFIYMDYNFFLIRSFTIVTLIAIFALTNRFKFIDEFSNRMKLNPLKTNSHFLIHSLALTLLLHSPKILEYLSTDSLIKTGYFQASYTMGMLPFFLLTISDSFYQSSVLNDKRSVLWNKYYLKFMPFLLYLMIIFVREMAFYVLPFEYFNPELISRIGASSLVAFWYSILIIIEIKDNDRKHLFKFGLLSFVLILVFIFGSLIENNLISYIPLLSYLVLMIGRVKNIKRLKINYTYIVLTIFLVLSLII